MEEYWEAKENYREKKKHGDGGFYLCVYNNEFLHAEHILECHWHEEMEFIYMKEGRAVFKVGTVPLEVKEGEAVVIRSGQLHSGYNVEHLYGRYDAVVFNPSMLSSGFVDTCERKYITPLVQNRMIFPQIIRGEEVWGKKILDELSNIINIYVKKPQGYEISIKASLYKIFSHLICNGKMNIDNLSFYDSSSINKIKKALGYIQKNYYKKIKLKELSAQANLSRYHFGRLFKNATGKTPIEYINCFRINKSVKLLEDKEKKIMDVAMDVGFYNLSYFTKTFKAYKKCTPSEFRIFKYGV